LIPPDVRGTAEKMTFIAAQRTRLNTLLGALDREAQQLQREETLRGGANDGDSNGNGYGDGDGDTSPWHSPLTRPASGLSGFSGASGLSKSRSEADFEKIDVVDGSSGGSGAEDEGVNMRRRHASKTKSERSSSSGWIPWGWGGAGRPDEKRKPDNDEKTDAKRD
jgi:hypothetical protein